MLLVLALVAGALIGLIPPLAAVLVVIAGMAVGGIVSARKWPTTAVRAREGAGGVMAALVVALVVVMVAPHASSENPLPSLSHPPTATPAASATANLAGLETPTHIGPATPPPTPVSGPTQFTATGSMKSARSNQTATLLPDGRTLIVGGDDGSGNLSSAELFG